MGSAAAFHARELPQPAVRAAWIFALARPAVALGSTQPQDHVDAAAAARHGVDVVRRRSGGGAVLLRPEDPLWVDLVVPVGDPLWDDDVGRATWWVGETWCRALASFDVDGDALGAGPDFHRGPLRRTAWSDRVCFAGVGAGEVTVGGRKLVGISQRRTRHAVRFQCAALLHWDPRALVEVLALSPAQRGECLEAVGSAAVGLAELVPPGSTAPGTGSDAADLRLRLEAAFLAALPI
jgi:lipoate-protein ligase A